MNAADNIDTINNETINNKDNKDKKRTNTNTYRRKDTVDVVEIDHIIDRVKSTHSPSKFHTFR